MVLEVIKSFKHKGLARFFESGQVMGIQPAHVKKLRLILGRLHASTVPRDLNLPGLRLHSLKGNMRGFYAVNVSGNWRITFRFDGNDVFDVNYTDYH